MLGWTHFDRSPGGGARHIFLLLRWVTAATALAVCGSSAQARAQPLGEPGVAYTAPSLCPDERAFRQALRDADVVFPSDAHVDVMVVFAPAGYQLQLNLRRGERQAQRSLDDEDCAALVNAAVVLLALSANALSANSLSANSLGVDPDGLSSATESAPESATESAPEHAIVPPSDDGSAGSSSPAESRQRSAILSEVHPLRQPQSAALIEDRALARGWSLPAIDGHLALQALFGSGSLPGISAGFGVALGADGEAARVAIAAAWWPKTNNVSGDAAALEAEQFSASLEPCLRLPLKRWELFSCATLQAHWVTATALNISKPQTDSVMWWSAGPNLTVGYRLGSLQFELGGGAVIPLKRPEFRYSEQATSRQRVLFRPAAVGMSGRLAVLHRF